MRAEGRAHNALPSKCNPSGVAMTDYEKSRGTKFGDMPFMQKITWIGKLVIAVCTFGFVYPNVMHD